MVPYNVAKLPQPSGDSHENNSSFINNCNKLLNQLILYPLMPNKKPKQKTPRAPPVPPEDATDGCGCGCECHAPPSTGMPIHILSDVCRRKGWHEPEYSVVPTALLNNQILADNDQDTNCKWLPSHSIHAQHITQRRKHRTPLYGAGYSPRCVH